MFVRYRSAITAGLLGFSLVALAGCAKKPAAVVNGTRIPQERFFEILERSQGAPLMVQLISEELVLQEAAKEKLTPGDEEVTRRYQEVKKDNQDLFKNVSETEAKRQVALTLAVRNLALKGVKVDDKEVKDAFDRNKARLDTPETVVAKRAVFKTKQEADAARSTLEKNKVEFSVILDKSIDFPDIRQNGGQLPPFVRTTDPKNPIVFMMNGGGQAMPQSADMLLGPGVATKLFAVPEKGTLEVVPSIQPQGFQVIQVQQHRQAKTATYAEWSERIREQLLIQKRFKNEPIPMGTDPLAYYRAQLVDKLRRAANIQINVESLKDVPQRTELWPTIPGGIGQ